MHIAVTIVESLSKAGGYEIFTYNLLKGLARAGHGVTLYAPKKRLRRDRPLLAGLDVTQRPLPARAVTLSKHCPALLALLMRLEQRRFGYDVWQVMGAYPEASLVRGLAGRVPLVLRAHGDDVQCAPELGYGMRQDPTLDAAIRANLAAMDRVVALTPGLREGFLELGVAPGAIEVIPNGIDMDQFDTPRDLAAVRRKFGVDADDFLILTVGRNHPKKGFDLIPEMARRLTEQGKRFTWLVVGSGTDAITPELKRHGLAEIVRPLPPITVPGNASVIDAVPPDELAELYRAADLFVFPSRLETFGRVIIEAMAARVPVVTTDALGCRDVAGMGEHAAMLPVDDVDGMTAAIQGLMDDSQSRSDLAEKGRKRAETYGWDRVVESYLSTYRALVP